MNTVKRDYIEPWIKVKTESTEQPSSKHKSWSQGSLVLGWFTVLCSESTIFGIPVQQLYRLYSKSITTVLKPDFFTWGKVILTGCNFSTGPITPGF